MDVVSAYEDGSSELDDERLLDRATKLGRVLFTQDDDLLVIATSRQRSGVPFWGVVYGHQHLTIGQCVADLEIIAKPGLPGDVDGRVNHLPL